jgi:hypothetical protein
MRHPATSLISGIVISLCFIGLMACAATGPSYNVARSTKDQVENLYERLYLSQKAVVCAKIPPETCHKALQRDPIMQEIRSRYVDVTLAQHDYVLALQEGRDTTETLAHVQQALKNFEDLGRTIQ